MGAIRLLYVPNEQGDFRQIGLRRPLANLVSSGLISEVSVFSLKLRVSRTDDAEEQRKLLVERIREFQPNVVIMQHLGKTGLRDDHFRQMRDAGNFLFIYHEGDPYLAPFHPLPREAKSAGRFADVVFTVGTGSFAENFRRSGAKDIRWSPSAFDVERYRYKAVSESPARDSDIVVIANRNSPRLRGHPNWRDRIRFVLQLQAHFGNRLALYGNGWEGASARGPIEFDSQDRAIRSAWVSANWDHYANEPKYFSNRLAISLASGSIHATTRHPGYASIFDQAMKPFMILGDSPRELVHSIDRMLSSTSLQDRIELAQSAQKFAYAQFRQDDWLVRYINSRGPLIDLNKAKESWDIDVDPLTEI